MDERGAAARGCPDCGQKSEPGELRLVHKSGCLVAARFAAVKAADVAWFEQWPGDTACVRPARVDEMIWQACILGESPWRCNDLVTVTRLPDDQIVYSVLLA